ncbi:MAG: Hsp33 family molecular chaperone HslO [Thermoanaerobacteraceae bacterium]|nr:Hsp33 family molecular chaperone HslO [Thermoanaerobacteraceae bacterium]
MGDYIVKAMVMDGKLLAYASTTRNTVEEARRIHGLSPVACAALGRCLTAVGMMGIMLKSDKGSITVQINGNGPLGNIVACSNSKANVKGYLNNPNVYLPIRPDGKLDVGSAVGRDGTLTVIRDLGLKEPYIGKVQLVTGEIADDFTAYYARSEQTPSSVGLGVLVDTDGSCKAAGGFIIQLMPDFPANMIGVLEEKLGKLSTITKYLESGKTPEYLLNLLLGDMGLEILYRVPTMFNCDCSIEKVERAIYSLGRREIEKLAEENEPLEVICDFCGKKYTVETDKINEMLK